jgi:hypothetical protein
MPVQQANGERSEDNEWNRHLAHPEPGPRRPDVSAAKASVRPLSWKEITNEDNKIYRQYKKKIADQRKVKFENAKK